MSSISKSVAVMLVVLFSMSLVASSSATVKGNPKTITVPDDYPTIQKAIDNAQIGDRIYVKSGIYHENLKVEKALSLMGQDVSTTKIDGNWTEKYLTPITVSSDNVTVTGFGLVDSWTGIALNEGSNCNITGNMMINNHYGILLASASGNILANNTISSTKFGAYGIQLNGASNNVIRENDVSLAAEGIAVVDELLSPTSVRISQNNSIIQNQVTNCSEYAVWLKFTKDNLLVGNTITNSKIGLALFETDNNRVYHNNFVYNIHQVAAGEEPIWSGGSGIRYSICSWEDDGKGNYWSDYNGTDENHDGIGDTPYVPTLKNIDNYPLMTPYVASYPSPSQAPETKQSEPFPTVPVAVLSGAVAAVLAIITVSSILHKRRQRTIKLGVIKNTSLVLFRAGLESS